MGLDMVSISLFGVLLVAAVVILAKLIWGSNRPANSQHKKAALDVLNQRNTRSEIEREEFEQKKRDLEG